MAILLYTFACMIGGVILFAIARLVPICWVVLRQSYYIFRPGERVVVRSPADIGSVYESFTLPVYAETFITGWFIPGRKERSGNGWHVLFCHGNAGNIGDLVDVADVISKLGFSVTLFDYRGYGESNGKPGEREMLEDANVCYRYLTQQRGIAKERIIWFGHSLGAAVACRAVVENPAGMLVMEGAFSSIPAMARLRYPKLPIDRYCKIRYDNMAAIQDVSVPVMIVHSREDKTCPFEHAQGLFELAHAPKCFVEITGGHDNGGLLTNSAYRQALLDYAAEWLP